jgi:hypothetical protein
MELILKHDKKKEWMNSDLEQVTAKQKMAMKG